MDMTPPSSIQRIKELLAKATDKPWSKDWLYGALRHINRNVDFDAFVSEGWEGKNPQKEDAELICLLRNTIESLLAERERHVEALERISKELIRIEYRGEDNARYESSDAVKIAKQALLSPESGKESK